MTASDAMTLLLLILGALLLTVLGIIVVVWAFAGVVSAAAWLWDKTIGRRRQK